MAQEYICMAFLDICAAKDTIPTPFLFRLAWFAKMFRGRK